MLIATLILLTLTGAAIFAAPLRCKAWVALAFVVLFALGGTAAAVGALAGILPPAGLSLPTLLFGEESLRMDALSALFTLLVAAGSVAAALYAKGYVDRYLDRKPAAHISLHYFAFTLLSLSMTAVVTASGGYTFLFWWELMTLSSFVLILFDAERKEVLKAALTYLVMMHLGFFALLIGFVVLQAAEGSADFGALAGYFAAHRPLPLLLVFLAGFGMKAGLFPMHVWLPEAHPAAPSHVSALMSGVMIKTGVYGVLRTAMYLPAGETLATAGVILLGAGIVTGLWGVLLAAMQNDIKRLLAYSSIENVGIIFIAIGVALLGRSAGNDAVALCGMAGALLHTLNHSFFKSLLFFGAGNLYAEAHTTALDRFGGVARQMPVTAILFLAGTAAICALPPLNGFVSEFIIYTGMFRSIAEGQQVLLAAAGVTALALIGGLALFAFTKLYGIVFLGAPRTHEVAEMHEADNYRIAAMALPAAGILFIGLLPWTVLPLLTKVAATLLPGLGAGRQPAAELPLWAGLTQITLVAAVLIAATALLLVAKRRALRRRTVASGPTWGCGFTAVNTRMQYTGESFVEGLESIVHPFTEEVVEGKAVDKQEIFPSAHDFDIRRKDRVARLFSAWWVESLRLLNARVMRLRTGKINHYILFALLFIVLVFLCSILNLL
ncbi:NADH-quinone oxidoreductase subunit E [Alistipes communis]|uniref:proton-conducting transporter transmembrane domain-containing protein n=1 Tax=Alistipes communis TaxID=2585118 RepID=UPI001D090D3E|nr:proton-conducting transporter membrane subunit [Alistipes communis]MCB6995126.1 NADH-quinone oxidoreductase subunit E [Alistipes communis]